MKNNFYARAVYSIDGAATTYQVLVATPATTTGVIETTAMLNLVANEEFAFEIYEGVTTSNDGTPSTKIFGTDRESARTAKTAICLAPTITDAGTKIWESRVWASKQTTGFGTHLSYNLLLKSNTKYVLKIIKTNAGTHYVDADLWWTEIEVGAI